MNAITAPAILAPPAASPDLAAARALTLLIGALGGEGGGVLTGWVVAAARASGYPVQATSIPGVAQRTGATTYYVELFPVRRERLAGRDPVLCLTPAAGHVDVLLSSEAMETARALQAGYVDGRTVVITSTHRVYATAEKMPLGDGRFDAAHGMSAVAQCARRVVAFDMAAETAAAGTVISAVMFGALIGAGVLPIAREAAERVIGAGGKAAEASLRGFAAGFRRAASASSADAGAATAATAATTTATASDAPTADAFIADADSDDPTGRAVATAPPASARAAPRAQPRDAMQVIELGAARCRDYLDDAYAGIYLQRVASIRVAHRDAGDALAREVARCLALWMCYEDIARVAELKSRPARFASIRAAARAGAAEPVRVVEFFKPGYDEVADLLPPAIAARIRAWAKRRGRRAIFEGGVHLVSTSITGYGKLRVLASLGRWRRRSSRYADEQALIERWLAAIRDAGDPQLALEIALTGRLIKGYSDTHQRGRANFVRLLDTLIEPAVLPPAERAAAVRTAREAALAGPEERRLDGELARHGVPPRPPRAVPIRFVPRRRSA